MSATDVSVQFHGPFEHHDVVVDGRRVPHLTAFTRADGGVDLILDRRLSMTIEDPAVVAGMTWFVANAIAIGMGFACHPSGNDEPAARNAWPRVMEIRDDRNGLRNVTDDRVAQPDERGCSTSQDAGSSPAAVSLEGASP